MGWTRLGLLLVVGCGRIAFDPISDASDGSTSGDTGASVGCWPAWRAGNPTVGAPRILDELSSAGNAQGDPSLSGDALTLYYQRGGATTNIFYATRPTRTSRWTFGGPVSELNSAANQAKLTVTPDNLTGVFSSDRNAGNWALFMATRALPTDLWGAPTQTLVSALNTGANNFDPDFTADGLHLYFAPDPGTGQHIVSAVRASPSAAFSIERNVTELAMGTTYSDPTLSPDELVIVYAANTNAMLFFATRTSTASNFNPPVAVPTVNGGGRQTDAELSSDGCELYFSSTRTGTKDLYVSVIAM